MLVGRRFPLLTEFLISIQRGGMKTRSSPGTRVGRGIAQTPGQLSGCPQRLIKKCSLAGPLLLDFSLYHQHLPSCAVLDSVGE